MRVQEVKLENYQRRYLLVGDNELPLMPVARYLKYIDNSENSKESKENEILYRTIKEAIE